MTAPNGNSALNDGKQVDLPPEMCDNDCGRVADPGCRDGVGRLCRQCHRGNRLGFDRQTRMKLATDAEQSIAKATAQSSQTEIAAITEAEIAHNGNATARKPRIKRALPPELFPSPDVAAIPPLDAPISATVPTPAPVVVAAPEAQKPPTDHPLKIATIAHVPLPRVLPPQNQPQPFHLRPDADTHPDLCRRDGCDRPLKSRGLCGSCHTIARTRDILEDVALPFRPHAERDHNALVELNRERSLRVKVEKLATEHPGITLDEAAKQIGTTRRSTARAVSALRTAGILCRPAVPSNHPDFWRLYARTSHEVECCRSCNRPAYCRGLCRRHYMVATRAGTLEKTGDPPKRVDSVTMVFAMVKAEPGIRNGVISNKTGLSPSQVRCAIFSLRERGMIHPVGYKKGLWPMENA